MRNEIIAKIEAMLAGQLDAGELAAWAFDRFYAEELGEVSLPEEDAELIAEVLDELMFADEPGFALEVEALRALVVRLRNV